MKKFVFLMLLSQSAWAWTVEDTYRQSAFTAIAVADWAQTRYVARNPQAFGEMNHLIHGHPSVGQVDAYFSAGIVAHAAISYSLPPAWRQGWQYVWIGIESQKVGRNHSLGVKFDF